DVLLVIAHPDDEAMFFTPTILALRDSVNVHVMSLSNGDYAGLGWVRASELVESCRLLGIPKERVSVVDDPSLQDGPTNTWSPDTISLYILPYLKKNGISTVITFDEYGVSGHPNHIAVHTALVKLVQNKRIEKGKAWKLQSVNLYNGLPDVADSLLLRSRSSLEMSEGKPGGDGRAFHHSTHSQAHNSQCEWFRHLFIVFGRYSYMNTLD
ncbi:hypothetical protein GUITHDRAFT_54525, partial [Guillardia theta CCMP2712]